MQKHGVDGRRFGTGPRKRFLAAARGRRILRDGGRATGSSWSNAGWSGSSWSGAGWPGERTRTATTARRAAGASGRAGSAADERPIAPPGRLGRVLVNGLACGVALMGIWVALANTVLRDPADFSRPGLGTVTIVGGPSAGMPIRLSGSPPAELDFGLPPKPVATVAIAAPSPVPDDASHDGLALASAGGFPAPSSALRVGASPEAVGAALPGLPAFPGVTDTTGAPDTTGALAPPADGAAVPLPPTRPEIARLAPPVVAGPVPMPRARPYAIAARPAAPFASPADPRTLTGTEIDRNRPY